MADDAEVTFDLIISASASTPTGVTNYRRLGHFTTQSGDTNVLLGSVGNIQRELEYAPSVRVYRASNQSIPNATSTALSFDTESWDNDNMHDSANQTRLTAQTPGTYLIIGNVQWASAASGSEQLQIRLNNATTLATVSMPISGSYVHEITTIYYLKAGDYVELMAYQSSGASLSVLYNLTSPSPIFMMIRLGD